MPIVAVVGEYNEPTTTMVKYLETLHTVQKISEPVINATLKALYGDNAYYPDFKIMNFTSKEALFEYTSADNYTFQGGNEGVCYGF